MTRPTLPPGTLIGFAFPAEVTHIIEREAKPVGRIGTWQEMTNREVANLSLLAAVARAEFAGRVKGFVIELTTTGHVACEVRQHEGQVIVGYMSDDATFTTLAMCQPPNFTELIRYLCAVHSASYNANRITDRVLIPHEAVEDIIRRGILAAAQEGIAPFD